MMPPGVKNNYEENTNWCIAQLTAYEIIRNLEEQQ